MHDGTYKDSELHNSRFELRLGVEPLLDLIVQSTHNDPLLRTSIKNELSLSRICI